MALKNKLYFIETEIYIDPNDKKKGSIIVKSIKSGTSVNKAIAKALKPYPSLERGFYDCTTLLIQRELLDNCEINYISARRKMIERWLDENEV